ncbi:SAVED domain-containing protein [Saccharopolyspora erythraea]|uniref:SAVED domain-containing protein n=1 Tax=Saccharopolyspora erythraea TaxID=1836 RepID=UPI00117ACCCA|nr:SAVED domain-containing protein [Saccharopolyspora erythraea]QRK88116.1 SAVED domain-containing protein [Saccharopolyspora erythraea]
MDDDMRQTPQITVEGSSEPARSHGWQAVWDGTLAFAFGGMFTGGFGVEFVKSFATGDDKGRWWITACLAIAVATLVLGTVQRRRQQRLQQVGIVATADDRKRGAYPDRDALAFSCTAYAATLKTSIILPENKPWNDHEIDALADEVVRAIQIATTTVSDSARINLIPTMPLNVGFWFGTRLKSDKAHEIAIHGRKRNNGSPSYFPATILRETTTTATPLEVGMETFEDGDPDVAAIALDLQGRGNDFLVPVRKVCQEHGARTLLSLRTWSTTIPETREAFTAVVEQACREWRKHTETTGAQRHRLIFLSGPIPIAVALGARFAPERGRWTAFTFDRDTSRYVPFPTRD